MRNIKAHHGPHILEVHGDAPGLHCLLPDLKEIADMSLCPSWFVLHRDAAPGGQLKALGGVLGLLQRDPQSFLQATPEGGLSNEEIEARVGARGTAKEARNFAESDPAQSLRNRALTQPSSCLLTLRSKNLMIEGCAGFWHIRRS